jgi:hypothetical protein
MSAPIRQEISEVSGWARIGAVDARYQAVTGAVIEHHLLAWAEMATAVTVIAKLRRAGVDGVSVALEDLTRAAERWVRCLTGAPVSPGDPAVGTSRLADGLRAHDASGIDSALHRELVRLADALDALERGTHPAAAVLEEIISRYGCSRADGGPAAYIAARSDETIPVRRWLAAEELVGEVLTPRELRKAPVRDALVLLGPPARYLVSAWCWLGEATKLGGWMLSAPPARQVHVVTWPGQPRLELTGATLFPVSDPPTVRTVRHASDEDQDDERRSVSDDVWLPPLPVQAYIPVAGAWAADHDPVTASGFRLAGDGVVFYSADATPASQIVTWGVDSVHITKGAPNLIKVGTVVLFRPERSATDDELHRRADGLLVEKYGPGAPAAAHAAKAELKEAYASCGHTDAQLEHMLDLRLRDSAYARHVISRLPDPGYIGPEKQGAYLALRSVLGLPEDTDRSQSNLLRRLRAACRRAGVDIVAELIAILRSTTAWQAELETCGHATVGAGPPLGQLDLRVVVAVDPQPKRIGRSRLGLPLPAPTGASQKGAQ